MAKEYRLNYTAEEIDAKLATVDETKNALENNYYTSVEIDDLIGDCNAVINSINALIGGEDV